MRLFLCSLLVCAGCFDFELLRQPRGNDDLPGIADLPAEDLAALADLAALPDLAAPADLAAAADISASEDLFDASVAADLVGPFDDLTPVLDLRPGPDLNAVGCNLLTMLEPWVYVRAGSVGGDGSLASPFGSIQAAMDAIPSGGSVLIAAGTYNESLVQPGGRAFITLYGGFNPQFTCRSYNANDTTITSVAGQPALRTNASVNLNYLTLNGTHGDVGGSIFRAVGIQIDALAANNIGLGTSNVNVNATSPVEAIGIDARRAALQLGSAIVRATIDGGGSPASTATAIRSCGSYVAQTNGYSLADGGPGSGIAISVTGQGCAFRPPPQINDPHVRLVVMLATGVGATRGKALQLRDTLADVTTDLSSAGLIAHSPNEAYAADFEGQQHRLVARSSTLRADNVASESASGAVLRVATPTFTLEPRDSLFSGRSILHVVDGGNWSLSLPPPDSVNLFWASTPHPSQTDLGALSLAIRDESTSPNPGDQSMTQLLAIDTHATTGLPLFTDELIAVSTSSPARNAAPNGVTGCNGVTFSFNGMVRPSGGACDIGAYEQ